MADSKKRQPADAFGPLIFRHLAEVVQPGQTVLLGFSGGLDSCVLLELLARCRAQRGFQLRALHVNHGISPHAADWEAFCARRCAALDVPFRAVRVTVPRDTGAGLEAAAREARYRALLAEPVDIVALAHHRDDQAETVVLQLLRGTGVKGLAAMPLLTPAQPHRPALLRPLLHTPRAALALWAAEQELSWVEDESNANLAQTRNWVRHTLLPAIECEIPAARAVLARAASHAAEATALLDELAAEDMARWGANGRLGLAGLRALSSPRGHNLLRGWLAFHGARAPSARRLHELRRQLMEAGGDAQVRIAVEGGTVRRYRDAAWFVPEFSGAVESLRWRGEACLEWVSGRITFTPVTGRGIAARLVAEHAFWLRWGGGVGTPFKPHAARPRRRLRHWFQDAGIPAWQRAGEPWLYCGDALAAVSGIGVDCAFQAAPDEAGWWPTWQPATSNAAVGC